MSKLPNDKTLWADLASTQGILREDRPEPFMNVMISIDDWIKSDIADRVRQHLDPVFAAKSLLHRLDWLEWKERGVQQKHWEPFTDNEDKSRAPNGWPCYEFMKTRDSVKFYYIGTWGY